MMEQGNLPTQRVNISTQKILGGIGSILILLGLVTEIEILFILFIVGFVLWLISIYQLSKKLEKPSIFQKVLIALILDVAVLGFILAVAVTVIAFVLEELMEGITPYVSMGDEVLADIKWWILVGIIAAYAILVVSAYFYKQAYEILAQATAHNLFKIAGLLMFIGAITTILFGLGLLLIIVGEIILAVAFFTAPNGRCQLLVFIGWAG